jgi:glucarate dehydratase
MQLATMLHLGAVVPKVSFAADAHHHHVRDDIIARGKFPYDRGTIAVLGPYPYDRDPARPEWYPLLPNTDWADPSA